MNLRQLVFVVGAGAIFSVGDVAIAGFTGLEVNQFPTAVSTPSGFRRVYRVYARFLEGTDWLKAWGSSPNTVPTNFHTSPCIGPFYQAIGGMNTAPTQELINKAPHVQWDTFATIGVNIADQGVPNDQTLLTPFFPIFISGNNFTMTSGAVYVSGSAPQARADFAGDGDLQLRVLMMQLTVMLEDFPQGTIGFIQWVDGSGSIHTETFNLTWSFSQPVGRCCLPTGTCVITDGPGCDDYNGQFLGCSPCDACELTCVPDIVPHPGNGVVDLDDLLAVINAWGPCSPTVTCPPDVSPDFGNNVVDIDDLLVVINGWGTCR